MHVLPYLCRRADVQAEAEQGEEEGGGEVLAAALRDVLHLQRGERPVQLTARPGSPHPRDVAHLPPARLLRQQCEPTHDGQREGRT
jgi:hypothetical protein